MGKLDDVGLRRDSAPRAGIAPGPVLSLNFRWMIASGDTMKSLLPLTLLALLLSGCPDTKLPKPPSNVPEPKVDGALYKSQWTKPDLGLMTAQA
ncbi:hypothetical protein [Polaromonas jejuensis]|uniref:Uncharacterized protein n=2 Tax=Polaromonas jejuensis TaxID=457502 RepID=A0ABW0QFB0_9BURK|nr:hypothetical protein [Polaromonas jejuensis]